MNRKEQIRTLWQACFDDSESSLDHFFNRVYKDENAVSIEKDGQVVSALQMLPYQMNWCDAEITVSYIYAACTAPSERGKGLMHELLQQAFALMYARGILATVLIPANDGLFDYYRTQGYTEVFDYSFICHPYPQQSHSADYTFSVIEERQADEWYGFFRQKQQEHPSSLLLSNTHFRLMIADQQISGGIVGCVTDKQHRQAALAIAIPDKGAVTIPRLYYVNETARQTLIKGIADYFHASNLKEIIPPILPNTYRMGMGKIINREKMLRIWINKHPEYQQRIKELEQMDIRELTSLLFDYPNRRAYMSLMPE